MKPYSIKFFVEALKNYQGTELHPTLLFRKVCLSNKETCRNPLDASSSFKYGGRFNFPNSFPALYLGFSEIAATLETSRRTNPLCTVFKPTDFQGTVAFPIVVSGKFVNLDDPHFSFDPNHPQYLIDTQVWENASPTAITHAIGDCVHTNGFDGIIYRSYEAFRRNYHPIIPEEAKCMVVFMAKDDCCSPKNKSCRIECLDQTLFEKLK